MKADVCHRVLFCLLFVWLWACTPCRAEGVEGDLSQKADVLGRIREDVLTNLRKVQEITTLMGHQRELFEKEIREAAAYGAAISFETAMTDSRISSNLDLLQRIHGYGAQLSVRALELQDLLAEVEFVLKETEDALRVQKALSVSNLSGLVTRIDRDVSMHPAVVGRRLLPANEMPVVDKKKIWELIMGGKTETDAKRSR